LGGETLTASYLRRALRAFLCRNEAIIVRFLWRWLSLPLVLLLTSYIFGFLWFPSRALEWASFAHKSLRRRRRAREGIIAATRRRAETARPRTAATAGKVQATSIANGSATTLAEQSTGKASQGEVAIRLPSLRVLALPPSIFRPHAVMSLFRIVGPRHWRGPDGQSIAYTHWVLSVKRDRRSTQGLCLLRH